MSGLKIHEKSCIGCGLCVKSCAYHALRIEEKKAKVNPDACVLCGICVETCPVNAMELRRKRGAAAEEIASTGVWVFAQQQDGRPLQVALELLSKARELADDLNEPLTAVLFGGDEQAPGILLKQGADLVYHCADARMRVPDEELYLPVFYELIERHRPAVLLFGATPFGRSLAPRLAARLKTGLTADCTELEIDPETNLLRQTRPAFGGNLMATIVCPDHRPQMATVRPGVMPVSERSYEGGIVVPVPVPEDLVSRIELISEVAAGQAAGVRDARIIVSAGRGVGVQKNMALVYRLAELLGAQVGASRPLVEEGWIAYEHQIGQTGSSVSPDLLITFGISGAIQHLAGIGGAKTIIAVNSDPEAPIFQVAHYSAVGDAQEILQEMIACLEAKQKQETA